MAQSIEPVSRVVRSSLAYADSLSLLSGRKANRKACCSNSALLAGLPPTVFSGS